MPALNVNMVSVGISAADLKALHSAPRELVAAPGPNKYIELLTWRLFYRFGTVQYTGGGFTRFTYGGANTYPSSPMAAPSAIDFKLGVSAQSYGSGWIESGSAAPELVATSGIVNKSLTLADLQSDYADGDGDAIVGLCYRIIDMPS